MSLPGSVISMFPVHMHRHFELSVRTGRPYVLYVPDPKKKWLPLKTGTDNLYVAKVPRTILHLTFKVGDKPRANEPYVIRGMGEQEEGSTDGEGVLKVDVPVHVRELEISFSSDGSTYTARIGDMDPIDEPSGIRKRLAHLGFYDPSPGEDLVGADARSLRAYQKWRGLPQTAAPDAATKAALLSDHGS
jgi:hypothetical protein